MRYFYSKYGWTEYAMGMGGAFDPLREDYSGGSRNGYDSDEVYLILEQEERLEAAGIDVSEFEWMSSYERQEVLEEAGIDSYEFDM